MKRRLACMAFPLALLAGCVPTPQPTEDIGVKRVGLALAFKDESLAKPVEPRVIIDFIPAPPDIIRQAAPELAPFTPPPPPRPARPPAIPSLCPIAPPDAAPEAPAPLSITKPPAAGKYRLVNQGTLKVTAGPLALNLPYPPFTQLEIANVKTTPRPATAGLVAQAPLTTFDAIETLAPTYTITESFSYDDLRLNLVSRTIKSGEATTTIKPVPAPRIYDFGGVGTDWTDVGIDSPANQALAIQGAIRSNKVVDLCGTVIDTFEVTANVQQVDATRQTTSGTRAGQSDFYDVAPQLGGLFARRELHDQTLLNSPSGPVTIETDVVSILGQITPSTK